MDAKAHELLNGVPEVSDALTAAKSGVEFFSGVTVIGAITGRSPKKVFLAVERGVTYGIPIDAVASLKSSGNHPWPWANARNRAEAAFAATYPAIHAHMSQYRDTLKKRQDQGEYWWELRARAYWEKFDQPKVMYQEIQTYPCYLLVYGKMLANNKVFFIPADDPYLLGVLNSPLMWWHNSRYLPHMINEALTPVAFLLERLPIARPTDETHKAAAVSVRRLIDITAQTHAGRCAVLDRFKEAFGVEKPSQKLQDVAALDAESLTAEVRKVRGKRKPLSAAEGRALKAEHARSVRPLQALASEARQLERRVAELVHAAYGLTAEEVALMWRTAPPRMPGEPPGGSGAGMDLAPRSARKHEPKGEPGA